MTNAAQRWTWEPLDEGSTIGMNAEIMFEGRHMARSYIAECPRIVAALNADDRRERGLRAMEATSAAFVSPQPFFGHAGEGHASSIRREDCPQCSPNPEHPAPDVEPMTVDRAIAVIARHAIAKAIDDIAEDWDSYAEIGEHDWEEITMEAQTLSPFPDKAEYDAAIALLASRVERDA